jgi:predicted nuclease of predicted toxin-antitoxin system
MPKKFRKYKLLLDENMPSRQAFPRLNMLFDLKHVRDDLKKAGASDREVYKIAEQSRRLIITNNVKHFKTQTGKSQETGVIGVSPHLSPHQVDIKLTALLRKSSEKALYGKYTALGDFS